MSFDMMRRRREVEIVTTNRRFTDDYGNEVTVDDYPVTVCATRKPLSADENTDDRDQQTQSFRYFFQPDAIIDGRSKIKDGDQVLEVTGEPERISTTLQVHHIEAIAKLIEG